MPVAELAVERLQHEKGFFTVLPGSSSPTMRAAGVFAKVRDSVSQIFSQSVSSLKHLKERESSSKEISMDELP